MATKVVASGLTFDGQEISICAKQGLLRSWQDTLSFFLGGHHQVCNRELCNSLQKEFLRSSLSRLLHWHGKEKLRN